MSAKAEDLHKNRIRLIYEYNRSSPLFVRIANQELENNNLDTATEILEEGLKNNPDFATPYFILGKIYTKKADYSRALKCYKKGSELIYSKETYQYYLRELEALKNLKMPPGFRIIDFTEEKKEPVEEEKKPPSFEDNLDTLAEKITHAKIPVGPEERNPGKYVANDISESSLIVSETLAKIYIAQGEINEAIMIYEKLIKKEPAKEEYFSQKISELKTKL